MKSNFPQSLAWVLESEGGFVNNPADPGGMTNLGVTKRTAEAFWMSSETEQSMRDLTPEKVAPLYKAMFWDKVKADQLPSGLDYALFDFAVNSGVHRASLTLQLILGTTPDGIIGPITISKANLLSQQNPTLLIKNLNLSRIEFLKHLPTWITFGQGWSNRVQSVTSNALSLLRP